MTHRQNDKVTTSTSPWSALMGWAVPGSTLTQAGASWLDALLEWQREVAHFAEARLSTDLRTQQALAGCTCITEVAKVQQDWALQAARDYSDELFRLIELQSRALGSGLRPSAAAPADSSTGKRAAAE